MKKKKILLLLCVFVFLCTSLIACNNDNNKTTTINITLNANDGSEATVQTVNQGEKFTPAVLTRDGYNFVGWYTTNNFSGDPVTEITPEADTSLYAKWEKLYKITLDIGGGQLNVTSINTIAGENVKSLVASLAPEKADCRFGMWLLDGQPLSDDTLMPAEDITLTARYQSKYTVEVYLQNDTLDGYEKNGEVITDYAYVGELFTSKQIVTGFREVKTADSITALTISDDPQKNLFRHYFDRAVYTLTFVSNYPDGSQNQMKTEEIIYGVKNTLPYVTFEMDGYYLEGWSLTSTGDVAYYSHVMDDRLFNADPHEKEILTLNDNMTLYAVWSRGYTDLFGGKDIIYVSCAEKDTVYLLRGNVFFRGELDKSDILFFDSNDDILYEGKLNSDGATFLYLNQSRSEKIATLYEMGEDKGLDDNVKIYFDTANGITYSVKQESGITSDSHGEYFFDENGYTIATFKDGDLAGKTLTMVVGTVTMNETATPAFQVRNEEEYEIGTILSYIIKNNEIVVNTDDDGNVINTLTLNGLGVATMNSGDDKKSSYYYTYDAEKKVLTLMNSQGATAGTLRLLERNGDLGYMLYDASKDVSYTLTDGSTLTLDGIATAVYQSGSLNVSGFYTVKASAFGGSILTFESGKTTYKFMITSKTEEIIIDPENPDSESEPKTTTTVEKKEPCYAEYYYKNEAGTYYAPLFVFEGKDRTTVTVYGYTPDKTFPKIATGTLVYNETTGTYQFTVIEHFDAPDAYTTPIDFATIQSCVMMLDETATAYNINFWLSYTDEEKTTETTTTYTADNGATLTLVAGLAISHIDGRIEVGTYKISGDTIALTFPGRQANVKFSEDTKTFAYYTPPKTVNEVGKDGSILQDHYLKYSVLEDATYYIISTDSESGDEIITTIAGSIKETGKTSLTGFPIYHFTSKETSSETGKPVAEMDIIQITNGNNQYFFTYDESYAGTFTSENGVLKLDGFGYAATYGDDTGRNIIGMYRKTDNDVIINAGSENIALLLDGSTCYLRGKEYGYSYLMMDNQAFWGKYVTLDGLGKARVFTIEVVDGENVQTDIDAEATYTLDDDNITLIYREGSEMHTLLCRMGIYKDASTSNAYNVLRVKHEEVVTAYVNVEDWSVLVLNNDGTATKYLKDGTAESGSFSLVTDSLLYYINDSLSDAYIYIYDRKTGIATPQNYDVYAYYTKDLESLMFTKYGFAIFNNKTRYYYTVNNGNVTIYHLDTENPNASEYGYVAEDFGQFTDTKIYDNKTYYKNDGYAVSFVRDPASADKYPVLVKAETDFRAPIEALTFTPTGGEEFSVTGSVTIADTNYNCLVVRELDEDGNPVMYVRVGYFYFYITINYLSDGSGSDTVSTYEVIGMSYNRSMPAYRYLYNLYYIYSMMGSSYAQNFQNNYGTVEMHSEYDEEGNVVETYFQADFGSDSPFYDADGNLITSIDHAELETLSNGYMKATFTADDGYTYVLYVAYGYVSVFQTDAYQIYALIREETVEANDGYQVKVGRLISSETLNNSMGSYFTIELSKDGELIPSSTIMLNENLYYIVRETDDDGNFTSTTYYKLDLKEKIKEIISGEGETEDETPDILPVYESATVTLIHGKTYQTADGESYVDILPDDQILLISWKGKSLLVTECVLNDGVYTLTISDGSTYTVTITNDVATITPLEQEEIDQEE